MPPSGNKQTKKIHHALTELMWAWLKKCNTATREGKLPSCCPLFVLVMV